MEERIRPIQRLHAGVRVRKRLAARLCSASEAREPHQREDDPGASAAPVEAAEAAADGYGDGLERIFWHADLARVDFGLLARGRRDNQRDPSSA